MKIENMFKLTPLWVIICFLLFSCAPPPEDELEGALGPGSGGDMVGTNLVSKDVTKADATVIGTLNYDGDYFTEIPSTDPSADSPLLYSLVGTTQTSLSLVFIRILGRPDTACRYQAALLARDEEYTIDESGLRTNDDDLEIYQVNVHKGSTYKSFFCTELKNNNGLSITITGASKAETSYLQVYAILNSIQSS